MLVFFCSGLGPGQRSVMATSLPSISAAS